jgi:hypothetical protein
MERISAIACSASDLERNTPLTASMVCHPSFDWFAHLFRSFITRVDSKPQGASGYDAELSRWSTPLFRLASKQVEAFMIRKLKSGQYRLYSRKKDPKTGRRRNLGTFGTKKAAEAHERAVQYFKHH